ncbi:RHS repeat-associated core domain-containing protein, partial [Sphingomonas sp. NCPPB 2930]
DAWGAVVEECNPHAIDQPIRFQGQQFDQETGLHYNRFRFYDLSIGRYLGQDLIRFNGDLNLEAYAFCDPVNHNDPLGLDAIFVHYVGYSVALTKNISVPLGHAGAIAIDPKNGETKYYEFGRYGGKCGNVRGPFDLGKVEFEDNGLPSQASINGVLKKASDSYGKHSPTYMEYSKKSYQEVIAYSEKRKAEADNCERPYNVLFDNCKNFGREASGR